MGLPKQFIHKVTFLTLATVLALTPLLLPLQQLSAPAIAQAATVLAVVGSAGAALYDVPGGAKVTALATGDVLNADGRTADSEWLQVVTDSGSKGWVSAGDVVAFGMNRLPVVGETPAAAENAAATAAPTAVPTTAPAATPTQAPTATPTQPPSPTPTSLPSPTPTQPAPTATAVPVADNGAATGGAAADAVTAIAVVGASGADLYDAPDGKVVATLPLAEALTLTGRDTSGAWLLALTNSGQTGWVEASAVVAFDVEKLPVATDESADAENAAASPTEVADAPLIDSAVVTETMALTSTTSAAPVTTAPEAGDATIAVVRDDSGARLNIRSGPGVAYSVVGKAAAGETLDVTGRNDDGSWLRVSCADLPAGEGWVSAAFVTAGDASTDMPVVESKAAPAAAQQERSVPAAGAASNGACYRRHRAAHTDQRAASRACHHQSQPLRSERQPGLYGWAQQHLPLQPGDRRGTLAYQRLRPSHQPRWEQSGLLPGRWG